LGDSFEKIKSIADNSIDMCLTDPPYFLDALGDDWDADAIEKRTLGSTGVVGSLPSGMKFDKAQGYEFEKFMRRISKEVFRVLKPGGFFVSCSAARLYHRMAVAIEDEGFDIRDMLGWTYQGQTKAFSMDHFIKKNTNLSEIEKQSLIEKLSGWKTPQLMPCIEPMTLAQKPTEGTFIQNWEKWGVGLWNSTAKFNNKFPGNIIPIPKPTKQEKVKFNTHVSVKPSELCTHLITLLTQEGALILDPFLGSGTTLVAAERTHRFCIGFEISEKYFAIIKRRYELEKNLIEGSELFQFT